MYYTGLSRGEALALTVNNVDFNAKKLRINKSLDIGDNTPQVKDTKTKAGVREIPMPDTLCGELMGYVKNLKSIYLFPNKNGELSSRSSFRRMLDRIMRKTKETAERIKSDFDNDVMSGTEDFVVSFTPHTFRHTYATNLYYAGIDVKKSQYYLGHSTIEMTLKIYTHLDNTRNEKEYTDKLNKFFSQSKISQNRKIVKIG